MEEYDQNKLILYMGTLIIDSCLLWAMIFDTLESNEFLFCLTSLLFHVLFCYSIHNEHKTILGILHVIMGSFILYSCLLNNIVILCACLFLMFTIQILWIMKGRCILNDFDGYFIHGHSKINRVGGLLVTVLLSAKIGYLL